MLFLRIVEKKIWLFNINYVFLQSLFVINIVIKIE